MTTMRDKVRAIAKEHGWKLVIAERGLYKLRRGTIALVYRKTGLGSVDFDIDCAEGHRTIAGARVGRHFVAHPLESADEGVARILPLVVERDVIEAARTLLEEIVRKYRREAEYREADLADFNREHPFETIELEEDE